MIELEFEFEGYLPIMFCGRVTDHVHFFCDVEVEYNRREDEFSYDIKDIRLRDFQGDEYQPSGENYDMVKRMIVELYDHKLNEVGGEKVEDQMVNWGVDDAYESWKDSVYA